MATFTWYYYGGAGPAWTDISTNTVVFAGSGGITTPITVGTWNDETHIGNGQPGTDQCGANHSNNVKYVSSTQFNANGGGTETLSDANLTQTECTLRIHFNEANSTITNARFYTFDNSTTTVEAVGIEAYAFENGESATTWTQVNDDSGNIGGDNSGERLDLGDQTSATDHYYYVAVSARPETVGSKTEFAFGIALTYS